NDVRSRNESSMKRFGSLLLAAVLGSAVTVASFKWFSDPSGTIQLNYTPLSAIPAAYTVDGDGKTVPLDFTAAAEKVMPAVVHIRSSNNGSRTHGQPYSPFEELFGPHFRQSPSLSSGSGVIISENGYIVTNNHVIQGAD